ncbi:MAG: hypothetical protein ISR43_04575 [Acidimicrobiia bacterium]|nr:hypothetical protein [Actinomycetota bacterium]MBL6924481.1 hypothetical protein [Acidimicrobiia bacterium]MBL6926485.1 hypothetical protein [Acidimicrobiia bacterium]
MHDIDDLERRGIPGVFVASGPFQDAAEVQANALGLPVRRVFVDHPIQDRTDAEMSALADAAIDLLVAALTSTPSNA